MADRVLLGKKSSDYGLWVSRATTEADSDTDKDMLMSSTSPSVGQILLFQKIDVNASASTTLDYKNHGGVKTFMNWWLNSDYLGGGGVSAGIGLYSSDYGFSGLLLTVTNEYINSTTNRITVANISLQSQSIIVMIFKEAAA